MPSGLASSSKIVTTLKGVKLPATKDQILEVAQAHDADDDVMMVLQRLPERDYESASDIAQGISQANKALKDMVPHTSASEVARYVSGIDFPATKDEVLEQAKQNGAPEDVLSIFGAMADKQFKSVIDVGRGIAEAKRTLRKERSEEAIAHPKAHQPENGGKKKAHAHK